MKKFYKDDDGADEEADVEEGKETKESEVQEGLVGKPGAAGENENKTGDSVAPLLSSVFDEEAAELEGHGAVVDVLDGSTVLVKDNMPCVSKDGVTLEGEEAQNLVTAEEKSEKSIDLAGEVSNEETALQEHRTDENEEASVENSETLKLVLEDTVVVEALDDTVEEEDNNVADEKIGEKVEKKGEKEGKIEEEEESLKLVLEPDTPIEEEDEIILSSQVD